MPKEHPITHLIDEMLAELHKLTPLDRVDDADRDKATAALIRIAKRRKTTR